MGVDVNQVFMRVKTTRRPDAVAQVNLSQRRAWFDETELPIPEGDEVPDWVKDPAKALAEIRRVRKQAGDYRTKHTDAEKKLLELQKKPDEPVKPTVKPEKPDDKKSDPDPAVIELKTQLEQLQSNLQSEKLANLRMRIANEAGLPVELAARLQGTTADEIKADAEALKKFVPAQEAPLPEPEKRYTRQTTPIPQGGAAAETDAQKRARIFNR